MKRHLLGVTAETKDVGGTIAVEVRVGDVLAGRFLTGTAYEDVALDVVTGRLAAHLRAILLMEATTADALDRCPDDRWDHR